MRAGDQPENRHGAWPKCAADASRHRRRGDRVERLFCCDCSQPLMAHRVVCCGAKSRTRDAAQCIALPPSTLIVWPVMKSLAADDRNITPPPDHPAPAPLDGAAGDARRDSCPMTTPPVIALRHPWRDGVHRDAVLADLARQRPRGRSRRPSTWCSAAGWDCPPTRDDEMLTIAVALRRIAGNTARQDRNMPRRLTAITRSHSSTGISSHERRASTLISEALLISTSSRRSLQRGLRHRRVDSSLEMSVAIPIACRPARPGRRYRLGGRAVDVGSDHAGAGLRVLRIGLASLAAAGDDDSASGQIKALVHVAASTRERRTLHGMRLLRQARRPLTRRCPAGAGAPARPFILRGPRKHAASSG